VTLAGTQTYDGTTNTPAGELTVTNVVAGDNVGLGGTGMLTSKNAGAEALASAGGALTGLSVSNANYTVTGGSGSVTVDPATLTYTANGASRTYGAANPAFSGTLTGFAPGDDQANATMGTLVFSSLATTSSSPGRYAIDGSGLTATNGNYLFVEAPGNATALTITPTTTVPTLDFVASPDQFLPVDPFGRVNPTASLNAAALTACTPDSIAAALAAHGRVLIFGPGGGC
jgi:hypothetical protein